MEEFRKCEEKPPKFLECCQEAVESSLDAIVSADESGRIILWNPAAEHMFGYTREQTLKMSISELMPEEYREKYLKGLRRFIETEKPVLIGKTVEVEGLRKDGSRFPKEISLSAKKMKGKWVFTGIICDITERKQIEEEFVKQNSELKTVNTELEALYKVSSAIGQTIDMDELFAIILKTVTGIELLNIEPKGGIFIIEGNNMNLVAHLGHTEEFLNLHKGMKIGDCLCGLAAKTGEIIISKNSGHDSRHTITYPGITPHGHIIVPLKARGRVVGVLYLYVPADVDVDEHKISILLSIGNQIGIAIDNTKLYNDN